MNMQIENISTFIGKMCVWNHGFLHWLMGRFAFLDSLGLLEKIPSHFLPRIFQEPTHFILILIREKNKTVIKPPRKSILNHWVCVELDRELLNNSIQTIISVVFLPCLFFRNHNIIPVVLTKTLMYVNNNKSEWYMEKQMPRSTIVNQKQYGWCNINSRMAIKLKE